MKPVIVDGTNVLGEFPHRRFHDDHEDMEAIESVWEMEPWEWEVWAKGQHLISLVAYSDGTVKLGPAHQWKRP